MKEGGAISKGWLWRGKKKFDFEGKDFNVMEHVQEEYERF